MSEKDENNGNDPELQSANFHKKFQSFVESGIKNITKNDQIATLGYKSDGKSKTKKSHAIEFVYDGYIEAQGRITPQISIKIKNQKCVWKAAWNIPYGQTDAKRLRFNPYLFGGWWFEFLKIREVSEDQNPLVEPGEINLRNVTKVDENFLVFWFGDGQADSNKSEKAAIERTAPIGEGSGDFEGFWKHLKLDGTKFKIESLPGIPEYDQEKSDFECNAELAEKWARFFIVLLVWRFILGVLSVEKNEQGKEAFTKTFKDKELDGSDEFIKSIFEALPLISEYRPKRPIDINPHNIYDLVKKERLEIPWHVISSVSAALNAGKHIIFTGPPGCGKTHLAKVISQQASKKAPLMATASQSWSTDEVIGRYMPTVDGAGLEFKSGFFLRALENDKWLVIDEINRCDIDNCFGELFTVLSGQSVSLPFEKVTDDEERKSLPIRIEVGGDIDSKNEESSSYIAINCSEKFRLLATMNDADVAGLHQLSYALRRRFAIIRVDAPDDEKKQDIFKKRIKDIFADLDLEKKKYSLKHKKNNEEIFYKMLGDQINGLFACDGGERGYDDLIDLGVVGIAPVLDIIRFVCEGLRSPDEKLTRITIKDGSAANTKSAESQLLNSFLAMGIVLNVFPQLDAITGEECRFKNAIKCILNAFEYKDIFLKIERTIDGTKKELVLVGTRYGKEETDLLTIKGYLMQELRRQYSKDLATLGLIDIVDSSKEYDATKEVEKVSQ